MSYTVLACAQSRADHVGRLGETLGPDSESLDDAVILRLDDGRLCVALATDPPYVREGMLCLACGSYDHTADACPTERAPEAPTDPILAAALSEPTGEPTLAPAGATGLVGVAYDVDLRRRHAGCSVCGGAGWIVEELRAPMKLCRREPPF